MQNDVDGFTDRLMYITGNSRSFAATATSLIILLKQRVAHCFMCILYEIKERWFKKMDGFGNNYQQNRITGAKFVAAANQCVDGIELMKKLFSFQASLCIGKSSKQPGLEY